MLMFSLDFERGKEKVEVHYGGDASYLVTINRGGMLLDTPEQIGDFINAVAASTDRLDGPFGDMQVVHVENRFAEPAPTGYRDFKVYLRAPNGHISTLRVVSRPFERGVFFETSRHKWEMARMLANTYVRAGECSYPIVLVGDNYLYDEPDSLHMVSGFDSTDDAMRYGLSRLWGRLAELKKISRSVEDLIDNWFLFGENISVQLEEGFINFDDPLEARIVDCDLDPALHWTGDQGKDYFKAPIRLGELG